MNLSNWLTIFIPWFTRGGHLEVNAHQLQTKQPKRPQNVCRLTQCNCHALSTEAPETDLALVPTPRLCQVPTPDPVNSTSSLSLAHLPVSESGDGILWIHFSNLSRSRPWQTRFFGQGCGEICCVGGRWQFFFVGDIWAKQARKFRRKTFAANFVADFAEPRPPSRPGWISRFRRFCPSFAVSRLGVPQHPATLLQCRSHTHELVDRYLTSQTFTWGVIQDFVYLSEVDRIFNLGQAGPV